MFGSAKYVGIVRKRCMHRGDLLSHEGTRHSTVEQIVTGRDSEAMESPAWSSVGLLTGARDSIGGMPGDCTVDLKVAERYGCDLRKSGLGMTN